MRVLVVYAHPVEKSYVSAVHESAVKALTEAGHQVDDCDLYAERFQPVMCRQERIDYFDTSKNRESIVNDVDRLLACEGLVFVFPTWWYGMPAILKGYLDRVWVPGVAFEIVDGRTRPLLHNISRVAVISTYGSPWWLNKFVLGDPVRKVFMRGIQHVFAPKAKKLWIAQYGLDQVGQGERQRFLDRVRRELRTL